MLQTIDDAMTDRFSMQRKAFDADRFPTLATRKERLKRLLALTTDHEAEICAAIDADFSARSAHETRIAELMVTRAGIRHALRHVGGWMRECRVPTSLHFRPGSNRLLPQPLGVVGIVVPWNYPFQLAIAPATGAIAAGNRVMIKPSELTPGFADLLTRLVATYFSPDEVAVVTGDAEVAKAFVSLPFDHLLFTGSTAVGRQVAAAAAANLTPVTLELGGKSPVIFDRSCEIDAAVASVAYAKLLNAGQTCIAPDYLLVPRGQTRAVADKLSRAIARLYPNLAGNPGYTAIVSERHHRRLSTLVSEAGAAGAEIITINPAAEDLGSGNRKFAPTLVLNPPEDTRLVQEEIFGPVLPVLEYDGIDEAIARVNAGDRPLALYWFGRDKAVRGRVLKETISGGVTVNDCLLHVAQEHQPFGGVGPSGMGAYHGEWGFRTFSKEKPVYLQSRFNLGGLIRPPYGPMTERMLRLMKMIT